jgi:mannosylglycerate hydrolase
VTLVRSVGWLSRRDLLTRGVGAGPDIATPEAQCLGEDRFEFELLAREAGQPGAFAMPRAQAFRRPPQLLRGHGLAGPAGPDVGNAVALTSSVRRLSDGRLELRLWTPITPSHEIALRAPAWQAVMADGRPDPVYAAQPGQLFVDRILTLRQGTA